VVEGRHWTPKVLGRKLTASCDGRLQENRTGLCPGVTGTGQSGEFAGDIKRIVQIPTVRFWCLERLQHGKVATSGGGKAALASRGAGGTNYLGGGQRRGARCRTTIAPANCLRCQLRVTFRKRRIVGRTRREIRCVQPCGEQEAREGGSAERGGNTTLTTRKQS
jgi:hypothetical protein